MLLGEGGSVDGKSPVNKPVGIHPLPDDGDKYAILIPLPGINGKLSDFFILITAEQSAPRDCYNIFDRDSFHNISKLLLQNSKEIPQDIYIILGDSSLFPKSPVNL